jgi:hypothetical protein
MCVLYPLWRADASITVILLAVKTDAPETQKPQQPVEGNCGFVAKAFQ